MEPAREVEHDAIGGEQPHRATDDHVAVDREERAPPGGYLVDADAEERVRDELLGEEAAAVGRVGKTRMPEDQVISEELFQSVEDGLARDQDFHEH